MNEKDLNLRRRERKAGSSGGASGSERSEAGQEAGEEEACERSETCGRILLSAPRTRASLFREMLLFIVNTKENSNLRRRELLSARDPKTTLRL